MEIKGLDRFSGTPYYHTLKDIIEHVCIEVESKYNLKASAFLLRQYDILGVSIGIDAFINNKQVRFIEDVDDQNLFGITSSSSFVQVLHSHLLDGISAIIEQEFFIEPVKNDPATEYISVQKFREIVQIVKEMDTHYKEVIEELQEKIKELEEAK